ncbi:MAG TPA: hypothetical protein VGH84_00230 [Steroidobacteraceae bacterium]|jgi:hypothetical protein
MKGKTMLSRKITVPTGIAALLAVALVVSVPARAGCGDASALGAPHASGRYLSMAFTTVDDDWVERSAIVGLWKFEMRISGTNQPPFTDGGLFDYGLATWHHDGTEIMFSGARPPSSGDVCMGAWRQTRRSTFKLNHIALGLAVAGPAAGTYVGPVAIRETVILDPSGNSYSGTFTLTQYQGVPSNVPWTELDETDALPIGMGSFKGTVKATRITADE